MSRLTRVEPARDRLNRVYTHSLTLPLSLSLSQVLAQVLSSPLLRHSKGKLLLTIFSSNHCIKGVLLVPDFIIGSLVRAVFFPKATQDCTVSLKVVWVTTTTTTVIDTLLRTLLTSTTA